MRFCLIVFLYSDQCVKLPGQNVPNLATCLASPTSCYSMTRLAHRVLVTLYNTGRPKS